MGEQEFDVVVVGAGFAGAAAAVALGSAGLDVVIVEARDRAGGRAFTRPFGGGSGEPMEFGGSWVAPFHHRIRHHCAQNGVILVPTTPVTERRWHDGGELRHDGAAGPEERTGYEAAMARIRSDARAQAGGQGSGEGGCRISDMSLSEYLDAIAANRAARAQILAWWCISGNGDPDTVSAAEFIASCAHGDGSPEDMMSALAHSLRPGASELVARMIASSRVKLRVGSPAEGVRRLSDGIVVETADGESYRARAVVLAVPLNVLATLRFAPPPAPRKLEAMTMGHGGCSFKLWIRAKGARPGTLVTGGLSGLQWMFAERESVGGAAMIVGFGLLDGRFDPSQRSDVSAGLKRFFPDATLITCDWHDWVADPFARGTWLAAPARATWIGEASEWQGEGGLFFASADFAPGTPGWFESAILSGEAAAGDILRLLS